MATVAIVRWVPLVLFAIQVFHSTCFALERTPAEVIPEASGVRAGNVLVLGPGSSNLGISLAARHKMRVYAFESDSEAVVKGRRLATVRQVYGKVTVSQGDLTKLHCSPLFFDLVIVKATDTKPAAGLVEAVYPYVKPNGKAMLLCAEDRKPGWRETMVGLGLKARRIDSHSSIGILYHKPGPSPDRDWYNWYRDAFHTNAAREPEFRPPLVPLWCAEMSPTGDNFTTPVVSDGVVSICERLTGRLLAYDAYSGEKLWMKVLPGVPEILRVLGGHSLYHAAVAGTTCVMTKRKTLMSFDIHSGELLWEKALPEDTVVDRYLQICGHENLYYILVREGRALTFDPRTGTMKPVKPILPRKAWIKKGDYVFYPEFWTASHRYMKWNVFDGPTNKLLYSFNQAGRARIALAENTIISTDFALDLATGKKKWMSPYFTWSCSTPVYAGGFSWQAKTGILFAQDPKTGAVVWHCKSPNTCNAPVIANGILYTSAHTDNILRAFTSANLLRVPAKRDRSDKPAIPETAPTPFPKPEVGREVAATPSKRPLPPLTDSDWPMFQGNSRRSGMAGVPTLKLPLKEQWRFQAGGAIRTQPCVAGGQAYFGSSDHRLYALDVSTGKRLWQFTCDNEILSSPCVDESSVYFAGTDGYLYALRRTDGTLRWKLSLLLPRPTPQPLPQAPLEEKFYPPWLPNCPIAWNGVPNKPSNALLKIAPIVWNGIVFMGTGEQGTFGHYIAVDARTGKILWTRESGTHAYYRTFAGVTSAPVIHRNILFWGDKIIQAMDPKSGHALPGWPEENWERCGRQRYRVLFSSNFSVSEDGIAYTWADHDGYHSGPMRAVDLHDNSVLWRAGGQGARHQSPLIAGNRVYFAYHGLKGRVPGIASYDRFTGRSGFLIKTPERVTGALCATRDHLFAAGIHGKIMAFDMKSRALVWSHSVGEPIRGSGALAADRYFIGTEKGSLIAFCTDPTGKSSSRPQLVQSIEEKESRK